MAIRQRGGLARRVPVRLSCFPRWWLSIALEHARYLPGELPRDGFRQHGERGLRRGPQRRAPSASAAANPVPDRAAMATTDAGSTTRVADAQPWERGCSAARPRVSSDVPAIEEGR